MSLCITCGKYPKRFGHQTCLTCAVEEIRKNKGIRMEAGPVPTHEDIRRQKMKSTPPSHANRRTHCTGCKRDKKEAGRLFKGLCPDCRNKPESVEPPAPPIAPKAPVAPPEQTITDPALGRTLIEGAREADLRLTIDFNDHPELLEKLRAFARKDFRAPEGQILYILKTVVGEGKATGDAT